MFANFSATIKQSQREAQRRLSAFHREEDGGMIIFGLFMFVMMLMVAGLAVDLMRFETTRAKLQGTMDRAVLAAADMDQTRPPADVVRDYFAKANMTQFLVGNPVVQEGLNFRRVSAQARGTMPMFFGGLLKTVDNNYNNTNTSTFDNQNYQGYRAVTPVLSVPANATAMEKVAKVEISLVVDISGSMANNNKIRNLRTAATQFVNTVLAPGNAGLISLSLVPYSEHVNAGPLLFNQLTTNKRHDFSYCVEFPDSEFDSVALNRAITYEQMQHFQWNWGSSNNYQNTRTDTVCPR
jgi:Flp pilus assembly protein TadG